MDCGKEGKDGRRIIRDDKNNFFSRCDWRGLYGTHSCICTASFFSEIGDGWAVRYTEIDKECGRKRFWYSDIGLKKDGGSVVVSVRISFAWNEERFKSSARGTGSDRAKGDSIHGIQESHVYSGRPEFRLVEKPIQFNESGMGKALCDFIMSPERGYPLIVFNGDGSGHLEEAGKIARELTGKALVAVVASNVELAEEIKEFLQSRSTVFTF